jgi:phage terminase large subunit-like protein
MKDADFFEFVKHDLKRIESDLKGFLEVYYPMLRSSWNPHNESDFIIGWLLGSKEQEYSTAYYHKINQRMGQELLFRIHQEITQHKQQIQKEVTMYLDTKSTK